MTRMLRALSERAAAEFVAGVERNATPRRSWLLVDADRTLGAADASREVATRLGINDCVCAVFRALGYTDEAFEFVSREFGSVTGAEYLGATRDVARGVDVRPAWTSVFAAVPASAHVVVVTAGSPEVWRATLERHGYGHLPVLGGCHPELHDFCVSAGSKAAVVHALRARGAHVTAVGDSLVDAPMLRASNRPVIVPDAKGSGPLRDALGDLRPLAHLVVDARRFVGLAPLDPIELAASLTSGGIAHDHRPNPRPADEAHDRTDSAGHLPR